MDQTLSFVKKLTNLENAFKRLDRGELTGRNAVASDATRRMRYDELAELARTDAVCDLLDAYAYLAARWNRIERRMVGLPA